MKFAKKIFVGALAIAVLISCFAFSTSAEAPALPREDIMDVLEYELYDTYLVENYDGLDEGVYEYQPADPNYFDFVTNASLGASVVKEGKNNVLLMQNSNSTKGAGYKFYRQGETLTDLLVVAFDFKLGDAGKTNGADFRISTALKDYFEEITLFSANASDDDNQYFEYANFNTDRATYGTEVMKDVELTLGTWYNVEIAFNPAKENYSIILKSGETQLFSYETKIVSQHGAVNRLTLYVSDAEDAGVTKIYLDNLYVLEGTYARDVIDPDNSLADFIIALDAYAKSGLTVEEKLHVADLYSELYGDDGIGYTPPTSIQKYQEVNKIVKGAKTYIWQAKADAFIEYSYNILEANASYVDKLKYKEEVAKEYYDMFVELASFEGMDGEYKAGKTYREAVDEAILEYERACTVIENIKSHTENFVFIIETDYDPKSRDFVYMQTKYNQLSALRDLVDPEYNYSEIVANTKYPKASDAVIVYGALEAKLNAIKANAELFIPAVLDMEIKKADGVSAESPYLTTNFAELYAKYIVAESVFADDTVHPSLDAKTYQAVYDAIQAYKTYKAYVEERVSESNNFIAIVKGAEASSYYVTVKSQVEAAALYLDDNVEKSLENIEGVAEAIELYTTLKAKVATDYENSQKYIAAVTAIDMNANYNALKQSVNKALALQSKGAVTGIDGIREANTKLEDAVAKVNQIEAYSNTLISAVDALYGAETLAERRALIFTANSVKDFAEPLISGVLDALEILEEEVELYNEDVAEMNALFGEVVESAVKLSNTVLSTEAVVKVTGGVIGAVK